MHHGGVKAKADFSADGKLCIAGQRHDEVGAIGQRRLDHGFRTQTFGQGDLAVQAPPRIVGVQVLRAQAQFGAATGRGW